jgi:DNA replication protein DnaC
MNGQLEAETILFKCPECGRELEIEANGFTDSLKGFEVLCDDCCEIRRNKEAIKSERQKFFERIESSGIPLELVAWNMEIGNNRLKCWVEANQDKSLLISGESGIGKTRSVCSMGASVAKDKPVVFWRCSDLCCEISRAAELSMHELSILKRQLRKCGLLILDDLGKEKLTDRTAEVLYDIIDYRYNSLKQVWITTNLSGTEFMHRLGIDKGPSMVRRLREMCQIWKPEELKLEL